MKRPLSGIWVAVAELKPRGSAHAAASQLHHPDRGRVEVVVDPVGVAVEVLYRVKRRAQCHQREGLAYPFVRLQLVVTRQQALCFCQQTDEDIVEIRIALKLAIQVVEVQE